MKFAKLQATGNDFILLDARNIERDWTKLAQSICQYHFGVGSDGLILVRNSKIADLKMRVFNSDGSEAEVCGNGLRCFAKYVNDHNIIIKRDLAIETLSGVRKVKANFTGNRVNGAEVNMGMPEFQPENIPVKVEVDIIPLLHYSLSVDNSELNLSILSMGNPHAVSFISQSVTDYPLAQIGPKIERHTIFTHRTNFEIASILTREKIEARVWERGVGETLACGSGACAIAVAAQLLNYVNRKVDIILPGGILTVSWDGVGEVFLAGPVEEVFTGEWLKGEFDEIS